MMLLEYLLYNLKYSFDQIHLDSYHLTDEFY